MRSFVVTALATACATSLVAACATVEDVGVEAAEAVQDTYHATLTGAEEVGPGDPEGYGTAQITVADAVDQICWDLNDIRGIGPVTAAHIHRGARGVNGPPVFTLTAGSDGDWKGCASRSEWVEDAIERNYANYYVNVHTAEYPNGAIRGQLRRP